MYSGALIIQTKTLDCPNSQEVTFYYEYYYNLLDGTSLVASALLLELKLHNGVGTTMKLGAGFKRQAAGGLGSAPILHDFRGGFRQNCLFSDTSSFSKNVASSILYSLQPLILMFTATNIIE